MSEDTGNVKFVQNYNREKILEKSLFWVEEPGCSSRTQKPAHQSAIFSAKKGVTPGGNDLELFLGQSWVSSQKMGSVSRKTKNAIFLHFVKIRKITKGGTLGIKKIQSARIWTKLAGLVGTIKKVSWDVILKCSCTLLGSEGSKTKNNAKGGRALKIPTTSSTQFSMLRRKFLVLSPSHWFPCKNSYALKALKPSFNT